MNQMFSALSSTGSLRTRFSGLTLNDLAPNLTPQQLQLLQALGIGPTTQMVLSVDQAQDQSGNPIPPLFCIQDTGDQAGAVGVTVRSQLLVRGIVPRDATLNDDRQLCACFDPDPACTDQPCTLFENLMKLNFVSHALLDTTGGAISIRFHVDVIQQLVRKSGFDALEALDLSAQEDSITQTSENSPLLALFRDRVNAGLPEFSVPSKLLTFSGYLEPANVRLVAARVDGAGFGQQDYFGIVADIVPKAIACDANISCPPASPLLARGRVSPDSLHSRADPVTDQADGQRATRVALSAAPNPFGSSTTISGEIGPGSGYDLSIYDVAGRQVRKVHGSRSGAVPVCLERPLRRRSSRRSRRLLLSAEDCSADTDSPTSAVAVAIGILRMAGPRTWAGQAALLP